MVLLTSILLYEDPIDDEFYLEMYELDNFDNFNEALAAFENCDYSTASRLFHQYIAEEPDNNRAAHALKFIKTCTKRTNDDFRAFREYCLDLADEHGEEVVGRAAQAHSDRAMDLLSTSAFLKFRHSEPTLQIPSTARPPSVMFCQPVHL